MLIKDHLCCHQILHGQAETLVDKDGLFLPNLLVVIADDVAQFRSDDCPALDDVTAFFGGRGAAVGRQKGRVAADVAKRKKRLVQNRRKMCAELPDQDFRRQLAEFGRHRADRQHQDAVVGGDVMGEQNRLFCKSGRHDDVSVLKEEIGQKNGEKFCQIRGMFPTSETALTTTFDTEKKDSMEFFGRNFASCHTDLHASFHGPFAPDGGSCGHPPGDLGPEALGGAV